MGNGNGHENGAPNGNGHKNGNGNGVASDPAERD